MEVRVTNVAVPLGQRGGQWVSLSRVDWVMYRGRLVLSDHVGRFFVYLRILFQGSRPPGKLWWIEFIDEDGVAVGLRPMVVLDSGSSSWSAWVKRMPPTAQVVDKGPRLCIETKGAPPLRRKIIGDRSLRKIVSRPAKVVAELHELCERIQTARLLVLMAHTYDKGSLFHWLPLELVYMVVKSIEA